MPCRFARAITGLRLLSLAACILFVAARMPAHAAPYENIRIDVNRADKTFAGTTAFMDTTSPSHPRIVEIDMQGSLVWDYPIKPEIFGGGIMPGTAIKGTDLEWLPASDRFLFVLTGIGVFEVDRAKNIVWKHLTKKISHDADRLPNGNTLYVWGWDGKEDAQATEIDPSGKVVWQWFAKDHLRRDPPQRQYQEHAPSYTHCNAAVRLPNGHTMISLRNFNVVMQVNPDGEIVWRLPRQNLVHDPMPMPGRNVLVSTRNPHRTVEFTRQHEEVWSFERDDVATVRGHQRLPNGNLLITERTKILEVTRDKEVVWQMALKGVAWTEEVKVAGAQRGKGPRGSGGGTKDQWLYKAVRIPSKN